MDILYVLFVMLQIFLSRRCYAQVKNASLPLVMWHGMGTCAVYCRYCFICDNSRRSSPPTIQEVLNSNDFIYRAQIAHAYRRRINEELHGRFFVNIAAIT